MVALTPSPSPFATLLRRSKFATFDPSIAQVFTVHGGDAHRGNWGFKRPLAVRRRGATITVKSVDTGAQQTEWNSGENQAKFMKRYEELNVEPRRRGWRERYETEFAPGETPQHIGFEINRFVQNPIAMKPKQFRKYLEQMRAKRPEFIAYLREKGKTDPRIGTKSMFELAQQPDTDYHAQFLADQAAAAHNTMKSRVMDRHVHKSGGLIYSRPSSLQTYLTTKPQPGRVLMDTIRRFRAQKEGYIVSFAGLAPLLIKRNVVSDLKRMRWKDSSDPQRGVGQFRMKNPSLRALPVVVGKRQGLKAMKLAAQVQDVLPAETDNARSNMHMPGSADYVAASPLPGKHGEHVAPMNFDDPARVKRFARYKPDNSAQNTIDILKDIIRNSVSTKPK
ncbi:hypothetical protein PILCRDRAFT_816216 [Piloderma croceum F 1598]|uniref:Uncharacterized protein n=1 Tax=Piloderma croceum (strain F 1598) TaxID=765440 RepID=A0A0C3C992_PILCF|nr:hypothetical protein PILCRDRAFT_816216 [Piloderma croceum F 1598]